MRSRTALSATVLLLAGCGDDDSATTTVRETVTETVTASVPGEAPTVLAVFFLRDGKVEPIARSVVAGEAVATAAMDELLKGPPVTEQEAGVGPVTAIPAETESGGVTIDDGVAEVELSRALARPAQAQVVYTLTQFPTIRRVQFLVEGQHQGGPRGRAAYEEQTPAILVLSPLPGEEVESDFEVTGTANTFEANFAYELLDAAGSALTTNFVTATSGSGTRGTFAFSVRYDVPKPQYGQLVVFENSAEDGSRINERRIPLGLR